MPQVSGFHNQSRKNSIVASKYASNPIGPREPNQIKAVQKPAANEEDDDQMETITQNDDELIDHVLLSKKFTDTTSLGSTKEFKKLTSRRFSGQ